MSQLRSEINRAQRVLAEKKRQDKEQDMVLIDDSVEAGEDIADDEVVNPEECDDSEPEGMSSSQWSACVTRWIGMLSSETDDQDEPIEEIELDGIHPADDDKAKWELGKLFPEGLEAPFFVEEL